MGRGCPQYQDKAPGFEARNRLRTFVRLHAPGGCKMLSLGDDCICPLCDIDLQARLIRNSTVEWNVTGNPAPENHEMGS